MICTKAIDTNGPQQAILKEIGWVDNNYKLMFMLLDQLELPENFKVLCGKKDASEVVNPRICLILLSHIFSMIFFCSFLLSFLSSTQLPHSHFTFHMLTPHDKTMEHNGITMAT